MLYDYELQAETAMRNAIGASGMERADWIRIAIFWQTLGRQDDIRVTAGSGLQLAERADRNPLLGSAA